MDYNKISKTALTYYYYIPPHYYDRGLPCVLSVTSLCCQSWFTLGLHCFKMVFSAKDKDTIKFLRQTKNLWRPNFKTCSELFSPKMFKIV